MYPIPLPSAKLVFLLGFAVCFFLLGMGAHKTFSDRKIARLKQEHAEYVAKAEKEAREASEQARTTEAALREAVVKREMEWMAAQVQRDNIVRDLAVAGDGLRNQLAALRRQASANPAPACRDLSHRVETLAVLLDERDRMAEESERTADDLRDELALCRGYATAVSKQE